MQFTAPLFTASSNLFSAGRSMLAPV